MKNELPKMWELSERELPQDWFKQGQAPEASKSRRAIAAVLSVRTKKLTVKAAQTLFDIKDTPYSRAASIVGSSPSITKKAWAGTKGFNLYDGHDKVRDTGCLYGSGEDATLQEWWGMIDPDLRHNLWKLQAARLHPDGKPEDALRDAKAMKFNTVSQKLEKQQLL